MITKKHPVPEHLAPFIKSFLIKEVEIVKSEVFFPAVSSSYFMFHYGDSYEMLLKNGNGVKFTPVTLSGISTMYSTFAEDKVKVKFAGAQLQPLAPYWLLQDKVKDLVDSTLDGQNLFPGSLETRSRIQSLNNNEEVVKVLTGYFTEIFKNVVPLDFGLKESLDIITSPQEMETIDHRLKNLDNKDRSFRRVFKKIMGLSPKLYMRVIRFEKVLSEIYSNPDLNYLTEMYGFYDQSHLIRECKYFAGRTPKVLADKLQDSNQQKYHTNLSEPR